jgi:hypothetical protein
LCIIQWKATIKQIKIRLFLAKDVFVQFFFSYYRRGETRSRWLLLYFMYFYISCFLCYHFVLTKHIYAPFIYFCEIQVDMKHFSSFDFLDFPVRDDKDSSFIYRGFCHSDLWIIVLTKDNFRNFPTIVRCFGKCQCLLLELVDAF